MIKRNEVSAELLTAVKNYLNITWEDEATDEKICGFIASASVYLDQKGGAVLDYEADGLPRTLLMEYVRYQNSSALDVFEVNFANQIMAMRDERQVREYVESTVSDE